MGKIIFFIIIAALLGTAAWLVKGSDDKTDEQKFQDVVNALKLKILQCKSKAMEGKEGAKEALEKYTKELEEIEAFNSKLTK